MEDSGGMVENLTALLDEAAASRGDLPAIVDADSGAELSWSALSDEVARYAHGLLGAGLVAGHRVAIALGNTPTFVTSYLAVLRAGLVAVPLNPRATPTELARMLADSGARLVVTDAGALGPVREAVAAIADALAAGDDRLRAGAVAPLVAVAGGTRSAGAVPIEERAWEDFRSAEPLASPPPRDPETLAVLLFTSGASGRPRAAMLPHRALLANLDQAAAVEPAILQPDDRLLGAVPLFHVYGLNAVLGGCLRHGATLVLLPVFDPDGSLDAIERQGVTVLPLAPAVFPRWREVGRVRERLAGVRLVLSGSAPLPPEVIEEFEEIAGVPVHQGYGLTEAAPIVTSTLAAAERPSYGSVGPALPGIEIALRDHGGGPPEGSDPGQIVVRGANLFTGYWPDGADGPDPEGWWATGDVGYLDADGSLVLVDRLSDLVIVSGFNVYPSEVEEVLAEVEGVAEVAVIGVPDERTGEAVQAYVVLAPGAGEETTLAAVEAYAGERLARFKQPRHVTVVPQLPYTATGKVAKGRLRAAVRRQALELLGE